MIIYSVPFRSSKDVIHQFPQLRAIRLMLTLWFGGFLFASSSDPVSLQFVFA